MVKELLSPVGNKECLYAAIHNGADAVYLGGKQFGARKFAGNFTKEELKKAVKEGLIDENVFALSGIEPSKFPELKEIGFSAAAIMGFIWQTNNF